MSRPDPPVSYGHRRADTIISPYSPYYQIRDDSDYFSVEMTSAPPSPAEEEMTMSHVVHLEWNQEVHEGTMIDIDDEDVSVNDSVPSFRPTDEEEKMGEDDVAELERAHRAAQVRFEDPITLSLMILASILPPLMSLVSYCVLTAQWYVTDKRVYFAISVAILVIASIAAATTGSISGWVLNSSRQSLRSYLSAPSFPLRHAITAVLAVCMICRGGPGEFFIPKPHSFHSMSTQLSFHKLGHVFFEAVPQFVLLSYVLIKERRTNFKDSLLRCSILMFSLIISIFSIVTGIVQTYFRWEPLVEKFAVGLFFLLMITARAGAIAAIFVEFGVWALLYLLVLVAARFLCLCRFRIIHLSKEMPWLSDVGCVTIVLLVLTLIPFGSQVKPASLHVEGVSRHRGLELAFGFTGEVVLTFRRRLLNDFSVGIMFIHFTETLSMILVAAVVSGIRPQFSRSGHLLILCWFSFIALALAPIFFFFAYWSVLQQEKKWKQNVDQALKTTIGEGPLRSNLLLDSINRPQSRWNSIVVKQMRTSHNAVVYVPDLLYFCYKIYRGPSYENSFDDIDALLAEIDFFRWGIENIERVNKLKQGGLKLTLADAISIEDIPQVKDVIFRAIEDDNVRPMLREALDSLAFDLSTCPPPPENKKTDVP